VHEVHVRSKIHTKQESCAVARKPCDVSKLFVWVWSLPTTSTTG